MIAELRCAVRWALAALHAAHSARPIKTCERESCRVGLVARRSFSEQVLRDALVTMRAAMSRSPVDALARELVSEALGLCREGRIVALGIELRHARERRAA